MLNWFLLILFAVIIYTKDTFRLGLLSEKLLIVLGIISLFIVTFYRVKYFNIILCETPEDMLLQVPQTYIDATSLILFFVFSSCLFVFIIYMKLYKYLNLNRTFLSFLCFLFNVSILILYLYANFYCIFGKVKEPFI